MSWVLKNVKIGPCDAIGAGYTLVPRNLASPSAKLLTKLLTIIDKINNANNIENITQQNLETAEAEEILHSCDSLFQPTEKDVIFFFI
jgi:hypothetical protein